MTPLPEPPGRGDPFPGALAPFAGGVATGDPAGSIPAATLLDPGVLADLLARTRGAFRCEPKPAASLWMQRYSTTLTAPAVATLVADAAPPRLGLADLRVRLSADGGHPLVFLALPSRGGAEEAAAGLRRLLHEHLAPLIEAVAALSGLSRRLLWDNAGWPLAWTLAELRRAAPASRAALERLLAPAAPAGAEPMLQRVRSHGLDGIPYRRRTCCLRDRIDGLPSCREMCPRRRAPAAINPCATGGAAGTGSRSAGPPRSA